MSKISKFSLEQKEQIMSEIKEVGVVVTVARKHGIDPKTIHNWMRAVKKR